MKRFLPALVALVSLLAPVVMPLLAGAGARAQAGGPVTELVMFERPGCLWCARWDKEIAPIYPRTPEGRLAPLRRVALGGLGAARADEMAAFGQPVIYTPSFVLVSGGREIGRITGYQGEEAFWGVLSQIIARLENSGPTVSASGFRPLQPETGAIGHEHDRP